ncbi:DegT/DnrJ/EryC1/StrS family aminotransferase [Paracoccus cavernae]|uniref:DegT/DnrJ/EryC1/StrS family aminotransferase n=1 Tax=Paracoccus cavernae TaxID=1571207 RepID=UPI00362B04CE
MPDISPVFFGAPMLPDPDHLAALMAEALAAGWLTNGGTLHMRFERAITENQALGDVASLTSSGTMALTLALMLGDLPRGAEVITSPISFAATTQAIAGLGLVPVFADVDPETLTLCPGAVEAAITPRTAAILPVHFLGVPCDVAALEVLASRHNLWLVYDSAHAFGSSIGGVPIGNFGDASAFSLHATKLLHTAEGGFVVTRAGKADSLRRMRNFGLEQGRVTGVGLNGKMSELHAAMGLALLPSLFPRSSRGRPSDRSTIALWRNCLGYGFTRAGRALEEALAITVCALPHPYGPVCTLPLPKRAFLPATSSPFYVVLALLGRTPRSSLSRAGPHCAQSCA